MSAPAKPRSGSRALIIAIVLAAVVAAALLVRLGGSAPVPRDDKPEPIPTDEQPNEARTSGRQLPPVNGAPPGGFAQDEEGAVAAAVVYTAASQRWLYLEDDEVVADVAAIAAPEAADRLIREVLADVQRARRELAVSPGRVWWLVHPLAWQVQSHGGSAASVAVWTVTVLSAADVAVPQAEWVTVTRSGGFEPLVRVPTDRWVVLGLVTTKRARLESVGDLARRIEAASRYVPLERLAVSPQCGFATSVLGNALTIDDERAKLGLVAEVARSVWG